MDTTRAVGRDRAPARLLAILVAASLAFWSLIFTRSIVSLDDMVFIGRGRDDATLEGIVESFRFDLVERNGRIADSVLSLVAAAGGEPLARGYYALACTLLIPTALIWLNYLVPRRARRALPAAVLPVVAATAPWMLLALDRRLISDLVLFGAASSGYFTGLFLVTVGLIPTLRALTDRPASNLTVMLSAPPLLIGALFHEVLATLVLGSALATAFIAIRQPARRRRLIPLVALQVAAVAAKAATPGFWTRAADTSQRTAGDLTLLGRTDFAVSLELIALVPLLGLLAAALAIAYPARGVSPRRLGIAAVAACGLGVLALGHRLLDGLPLPGIVTAAAVVVLVVFAVALQPASIRPVELLAMTAAVLALCIPAYGGLTPGRAWFFSEFLILLIALSQFITAAAPSAGDGIGTMHSSKIRALAIALAGAGVFAAPVLAYEMVDKVNDNHAWQAFVDEQVQGQRDGTVEIPWTYPWNDMRPSFAPDHEHVIHEPVVRAYYGIDPDVEVVWNGAVDWSAE